MIAHALLCGHATRVGEQEASAAATAIERLFGGADRLLARRPIWILVILLVLGLQGALIVTHSAWPDEWQALLIALQSPDWRHLIDNLRYEGHPPLWYALLLLVGAGGVAPGAILVTSQLIVAGATKLLILFFCPLRRAERLLLCVSYLLLFEYGAIARGYGLGVLLVLAFAAAGGRRTGWLPLALLPLVDFHFGLLSLIGVAARWRDRRWWWPGVALWLSCGLLAAWSVLPPPDLVPATSEAHAPLAALAGALAVFGNLLFHLPIVEGHYYWEGVLPLGIGPVAGAIYLLLAHRSASRERGQLIAFWLFVVVLIAFAALVYDLSTRIAGLATILLIVIVWRDAERGSAPVPAFRQLLLANALAGLIAAGVAAAVPFDRAPEVVGWLRSHGAERGLIAAYPVLHGTSVGARLGSEIEVIGKDCRQSFVRWDAHDRAGSPPTLIAAVRAAALHYGPYTLIVRGDLARDLGRWFDPRLLRLEARFPPGMDGRRYFVYQVGAGLPATGRLPPRCRPVERLPLPPLG